MNAGTGSLDADQRPAEPPPPMREGYRTMPGSTPRAGLPDRRPYVRTEGAAERDAEVARLLAQTIAEARRRVPEWQPWMRECLTATRWGRGGHVGEWIRRHRGGVPS